LTGPFSEAIVELTGCETHAMWWGGSVVVREVAGGWMPVAYLPGFLPAACELRRGDDQIDRLACRDAHAENGGTYLTAATVVDLRARRERVLLSAECEDARDIESVAWATPTGFDVDVRVVHGMHRVNDGSCRDTGGKRSASVLRYLDHDGTYEPDSRAFRALLALVPTAPELDPTVRAATGARERLPREVTPSSNALTFVDLPLCASANSTNR